MSKKSALAQLVSKDTTAVMAGPIGTVPMLHHPVGRVEENNYVDWLPKMELHLSSIHGEASYTLISGKLWEPEEVPLPVINANDPPLVVKRKEDSYLTLCKDRDKQLIKLKREIYPSFFAAIWNQMSLASQDRVKTCAGEAYAELMRKKDFVQLVKFVKQAHLGSMKTVSEEDKRRATEAFFRLKQLPNESLAAFKLRFDTLLDTYDAVKEPRPPEERQAVEYLAKLDPVRFSAMRVHVENQRALQPAADPTPKTLAAAHELASMWVVPASPLLGGDSPVFAVADEIEASSEPGANSKAKTVGAKTRGAKAVERDLKCYICASSDHLVSACPYLEKAQAMAKEAIEEEEKDIAIAVALQYADDYECDSD